MNNVRKELNRNSYGFEISREFYTKAKKQMLNFENVKSYRQLEIQ